MAFVCPKCGRVADTLTRPVSCRFCGAQMISTAEKALGGTVALSGGGKSAYERSYPTVKPIGDKQWLEDVSEDAAAYMDDVDALADREAFVHNLGVLLTQTREGVVKCELIDNGDTVVITFKGEAKRSVNVRLDSYAAIIRDVMRNV